MLFLWEVCVAASQCDEGFNLYSLFKEDLSFLFYGLICNIFYFSPVVLP